MLSWAAVGLTGLGRHHWMYRDEVIGDSRKVRTEREKDESGPANEGEVDNEDCYELCLPMVRSP